jgi:hypothetical protein
VSGDEETLRWPTNLDHKAIVLRLIQFRDAAQSSGLPDLAARFANVETMAAGKIGANVIAAITWLLGKPEYQPLATRLEMVAVNLKNLK